MPQCCTPHGCDWDNGRAIDRVEVDVPTQAALVFFHDGSQYRFDGLDWNTLYAWAGSGDPGCYFNRFIAPGNYTKIAGPSR